MAISASPMRIASLVLSTTSVRSKARKWLIETRWHTDRHTAAISWVGEVSINACDNASVHAREQDRA
ncbi:MAG TPA: hypothetical protein PL196_01740, partial [Burkholderiaceae bacterium]|nr:hypothetical protein [Burkholderiaceae bacterium]